MNDLNLTNSPGVENNVLAYVDLTLLSCDLKGVYQYQVKNATKDNEEKITQILVMPTDSEPQGMKLTELIAEVNSIIKSFGGGEPVTSDEMEATLESMGLKTFADIEIQIRQLFIYVDSSSIEGNSKPFEYALNFVVLNPIDPEDKNLIKVFRINKLGLALYNTKRKKIIERMDLENIDELLE